MNAELDITGSGLTTPLLDILMADNIQVGSDLGYQLCKQLYLHHPLGAKIVDLPIVKALSKPRKLSVPNSPEDLVVKAFVDEWNALKVDSIIANIARQARIYGFGSAIMGVDDEGVESEQKTKTNEPLPLEQLYKLNIFFNVLDPLNTAGSVILSQDANSVDFQRIDSVTCQGKPYHHSRVCTFMNERPIYLSYTQSSYGYVGRSVFTRSLFPMKSYIRSMITDDSVATKAGLLVMKTKKAGTIVNKTMLAISEFKRTVLKGAATGNVLDMGTDDSVETLNMTNVNQAMDASRKNILENIAAAAGLPAKLLSNETFATGFGEGAEDAKEIAEYIDWFRNELQPLYDFFDQIVMYRAWNPEFYETIKPRCPSYKDVSWQAAFNSWKKSFCAEWENLLKEPDSELIKVEETKFKAINDLIGAVYDKLDPVNQGAVLEWAQTNLNDNKLLFPNPLEIDPDLLIQYSAEQQAQAQQQQAQQLALMQQQPQSNEQPAYADSVAYADGWITLNGESGEEGNGGSHVFVGAGGTIEKGASGLKGKKLSDLKGTKKFTKYETNAEREQPEPLKGAARLRAMNEQRAKEKEADKLANPEKYEPAKSSPKKNTLESDHHVNEHYAKATIPELEKMHKDMKAKGEKLSLKALENTPTGKGGGGNQRKNNQRDTTGGNMLANAMDLESYINARKNAEREQSQAKETKQSEQSATDKPIESNNLTKQSNHETMSPTSQSEAHTGEAKMNANNILNAVKTDKKQSTLFLKPSHTAIAIASMTSTQMDGKHEKSVMSLNDSLAAIGINKDGTLMNGGKLDKDEFEKIKDFVSKNKGFYNKNTDEFGGVGGEWLESQAKKFEINHKAYGRDADKKNAAYLAEKEKEKEFYKNQAAPAKQQSASNSGGNKSSVLTSGADAGKIKVEYGHNSKMYDDLKKLKGAKYIKSGLFYIPSEHAKAVADLSKKHGLELSDGFKRNFPEESNLTPQSNHETMSPTSQSEANTGDKTMNVTDFLEKHYPHNAKNAQYTKGTEHHDSNVNFHLDNAIKEEMGSDIKPISQNGGGEFSDKQRKNFMQAVEESQNENKPALVGTEKQVEWANSIRDKAFKKLNYVKSFLNNINYDAIPEANHAVIKPLIGEILTNIEDIKSIDSAKKWIDNKGFDLNSQLLNPSKKGVINSLLTSAATDKFQK
ncbi:MAG: hypothetical protein RL755_65 [Pseudomonadota bacterium]|jgi:hypothetical protein